MKIALGLFHFNVQYVAGDPAAYHRYCTQVVLPFLHAIASCNEFRVTFEMSGNGLEFLAENYPAAIDLLHSLIADNKIELVSSTSTPTLWVAFPWRDLEQSIKLNRKVLERLNLPVSRIFFAQEGFFGSGLKVVSDWFDIAVCKDDTLRMLGGAAEVRPFYQLGKLTVIVGANHLLNELLGSIIRASQKVRAMECSSFYEAHIREAVNTASHSAAECIDGNTAGMQWHWYHLGSAHHFTTPASPQNWETFFYDPGWMALSVGVFDQLLTEGYRLGFIREFARCLKKLPLEPLPRMLEGSWNPKRSGGVYVWMGRQQHRWQRTLAILMLAWRARTTLRQAELALNGVPDLSMRQELQGEIDEIWKQQILAESSDPLGWAPLPCEVNFGRQQGERVLKTCAASMSRLPRVVAQIEKRMGTRIATPLVATELIGAEGNAEWFQISKSLYLCEARFRAVQRACGIRFKRNLGSTIYCPSGSEQQPVAIALDEFQQSEFYLPLTNGFISLHHDLHLIRDNCSAAVAARLLKHEPWVTFAVEGILEGRLYQWRFFLLQGTVEDAVRTANQINSI